MGWVSLFFLFFCTRRVPAVSDYEKKKKTERGKDTRVAVSRMRTTQAWQANFHVHAFLIKSNKYIYIYISFPYILLTSFSMPSMAILVPFPL